MSKIKTIKAREILNSRGLPTLEVDVTLDSGHMARAQVPSGASKGEKEALELLDNDLTRFCGYGVLNAVRNINSIIAQELIGVDSQKQRVIDGIMISIDGSDNKSVLGANAILGVSLAVCKASAKARELPLFMVFRDLIEEGGADFTYSPPIPMLNVINGGLHADNALAIQEFMLVPIGFKTFKDAITKSAEIFYRLKAILKEKKYSTNVGDEGGFAPSLESTEDAIKILNQAIGKENEGKIKIGLDSAASTFLRDGKYQIDGKSLTSDEMIEFYDRLVSQYDIISIEDPLEENDKIGWQNFTKKLDSRIKIVGDDIFVTNPKIFADCIKNGIANAILIKMNQIGTITETIDTIRLAKRSNYSVVISHRSGETEDTSIAHLAVACGAGAMIKSGSLARSERVAKYNEILRIEENYV